MIIGHFNCNSLDVIVVFVAQLLSGQEDEFELGRLDFDELRPRPNFRNEKRGRKPNVELSHSALRLILSVLTIFASFCVDTTKLFALCFRLFFLDVPVLLPGILSFVSIVAIEPQHLVNELKVKSR